MLPDCSYRNHNGEETFSCRAADDGVVIAEDCAACPIPSALAHEKVCLYLVPLRLNGEARFVCRWSFDWAREPAPTDWRKLCLCPYWFPRPGDESMIKDLGARRTQYAAKLQAGVVQRDV